MKGQIDRGTKLTTSELSNRSRFYAKNGLYIYVLLKQKISYDFYHNEYKEDLIQEAYIYYSEKKNGLWRFVTTQRDYELLSIDFLEWYRSQVATDYNNFTRYKLQGRFTKNLAQGRKSVSLIKTDKIEKDDYWLKNNE